MTDVTQLSDEALVDDCCVAFADAYDPSGGLLANVEAKVRWESHKAELLRRLRARSVEGLVATIEALPTNEHTFYYFGEDVIKSIREWAGEA